jgi:hypothetical protein
MFLHFTGLFVAVVGIAGPNQVVLPCSTVLMCRLLLVFCTAALADRTRRHWHHRHHSTLLLRPPLTLLPPRLLPLRLLPCVALRQLLPLPLLHHCCHLSLTLLLLLLALLRGAARGAARAASRTSA